MENQKLERQRKVTATRTIKLPDGGHLNARVDGPEGAPWIVFANSVLSDLTSWDAQVANLKDRFRLLRFDQRGHGRSTLPAGPLTFEDYGADLLTVLDDCGVDHCIFVGLSMGVPTGLAAYRASPGRFIAFVAVDGMAKSTGRAAFWTERRETAQNIGMGEIAESTALRWLPGCQESSPTVVDAKKMIEATSVEGFSAATHALEGYDYSDAFNAFAIPFLGIAGALDGAMPKTMPEQFGPIPDSEFCEIPAAGHIPNFQNPDAFNSVLGTFLDQVTRRGIA